MAWSQAGIKELKALRAKIIGTHNGSNFGDLVGTLLREAQRVDLSQEQVTVCREQIAVVEQERGALEDFLAQVQDALDVPRGSSLSRTMVAVRDAAIDRDAAEQAARAQALWEKNVCPACGPTLDTLEETVGVRRPRETDGDYLERILQAGKR